jgi:hypothetical protein
MSSSVVNAEEWTVSQLVRFGEFRHPTTFKRLKAVWEEPDFQGSQAALNTSNMSDGVMNIEFNIEYHDLDEMWNQDLQKNHSYIHYKVKKNDWYVVSGVNSYGMVFYTKAWYIETMCVSISFLYPNKYSSKYDRLLEQMLKGFKPKLVLADF